MFREIVSKRLSLHLSAILLGALLSTGAHATWGYQSYSYYDVDADLGAYSPIVLGDDLELDACNSIVVNANNASDYHALCAFADWSLNYDFKLTWTVSYGGVTSTIASYSGPYTNGGSSPDGLASEGTQITVATGPGTLFSTVGNYVIGLWVDMDDYDSIYLPNSSWGHTGSDGTWNPAQSGYLNVDFAQTSLSIEAASVPEPAAALLLLPALMMVRRKHKLQRQAQV